MYEMYETYIFSVSIYIPQILYVASGVSAR